MRVWQAQIGLNKRVENEYYGYVEVHDYNPDMFELPNPLMLLALTRKNNSKSIELINRMYEDVDKTVDTLKSKFDAKIMTDELRPLATEVASKSFNQEGLGLFNSNPNAIIEAFALGVALGRLDPNRRGERPVVAIGLQNEALKKMQKEYTDGDTGGGACAILLQKGFYLARAFGF